MTRWTPRNVFSAIYRHLETTEWDQTTSAECTNERKCCATQIAHLLGPTSWSRGQRWVLVLNSAGVGITPARHGRRAPHTESLSNSDHNPAHQFGNGCSDPLRYKYAKLPIALYLLGVEVNRDQWGGSSRTRSAHCTSGWLTPASIPYANISGA